jgi:hypothetical protein
VINDEELKRFHDWLQAKGENPSVVLALRWIAESTQRKTRGSSWRSRL